MKRFSDLVALPHTVFALPFALGAAALAFRRAPFSFGRIIWIAVGVASLRAASMAWNRYIDRAIDARNPRTRMREIPRGDVSPAAALAVMAIGLGGFLISAYMLGRLPLLLTPIAVVLAFGYSLSKRF